MKNVSNSSSSPLETGEPGDLSPCCVDHHQRWDQLLATVALKIQQAVDLQNILQTTADEVRQLLQCDRVLLYHFAADWSGLVVAESVLNPQWSLMDRVVRDTCFEASWIDPYRMGRYAAIADTRTANLTPCYAAFLDHFQIRANLVIPILQQETLWGLLIAHNCQEPRTWQALEIQGLQHLAVQVGIAIYQTALIEHLQTAKHELETQVSQRTLELQQANQQLAQLANIVESSHDPIISINLDQKITSWNQAATDLFQYLPEEIIGQPISLLMSPNSSEELKWIFQCLLKDQKICNYATQRSCKDGSLIDVEMTISANYSATKELIGGSAIIRDVRDRLQAEQRLADQAATLRVFYETSPLMMGTVEISETDIHHLSDNLATHQFFGIAADSLSGQWASDMGTSPAVLQLWLDHYQLSQTQRKPISFEYEHCTPTQTYWLAVTVRFLDIAENGYARFAYIAQDISDRKKAEIHRLETEKIQREQQRLESLLDLVLAGYWDWDLVKDHEYFSPGFKRILGYEQEELPNIPHIGQMLVFKEDLPRLLESFAQHVSSRGVIPYRSEVRYHHKNGSTIWMTCAGHVIEWDAEGNPQRMIGCNIDITDRKKAEIDLKNLSDRLTLALSSGSIGMWHLCPGDSAVTWDAQMYRIYGLETLSRPVTYQDWVDLLHPEDRDRAVATFQQAINAGHSLDMEFRIYRAHDQQLRWIKAAAQLITDPKGDHMIGINYDISDQKQNEADLEAAKSQLEWVIQASSEGFWDWDLVTGQIYFSSQWKALLGYEDHELENSLEMWKSVICEEDAVRAMKLVNDYNCGYIDQFIDTQRFYHKDGSIVYILSRAIHLKNLQGEAIRMIGSHLDITETVRIQKALKNSEMYLSGILNSSLDGIMAFESVRDSSGKIIDFQWKLSNPKACEIVNRTESDLIGKKLLEQLPGNQDAGLFDGYVQVVESGKPFQHEFHYNHDGIDCWFENIAVKLGDGFVVTFRNITFLKQSEQSLQQTNEELENRLLDLQERNAEMARLGEMSDFLQACITVQEACQAIASLVEPLFPGCLGGLLMMSHSRDHLEVAAYWGGGPRINRQGGLQLPDSLGVFQPHHCWGLRRGKVHWVSPDRQGLRCPHVYPIGCQAATLCVPMIAQGETLGLFYLSAPHASALTPAKRQLARTVAEQVSLAIANLNLRETLHHQSVRDSLTGLFNRRYLEESLTRELARATRHGTPLGVIMIDVDHFKRFNDTYGHAAGDRILQAIAELLKVNVRGSDVPCRYGGEELTLVLTDADLATTVTRAERIRTAIAQLQVEYRGMMLGNLTASLGVAACPEHGSTGQRLLQAADAALYQAKARGRNGVVVATPHPAPPSRTNLAPAQDSDNTMI